MLNSTMGGWMDGWINRLTDAGQCLSSFVFTSLKVNVFMSSLRSTKKKDKILARAQKTLIGTTQNID